MEVTHTTEFGTRVIWLSSGPQLTFEKDDVERFWMRVQYGDFTVSVELNQLEILQVIEILAVGARVGTGKGEDIIHTLAESAQCIHSWAKIDDLWKCRHCLRTSDTNPMVDRKSSEDIDDLYAAWAEQHPATHGEDQG